MFISRKNYDKLKDEIYFWQQKNEDKIRQLKYQEAKIDNLKEKLLLLEAQEKLNSRMYEVKITITGHIILHYDIKAYSHKEAREIATKIFVKNNKDFSKNDILVIETSAIS